MFCIALSTFVTTPTQLPFLPLISAPQVVEKALGVFILVLLGFFDWNFGTFFGQLCCCLFQGHRFNIKREVLSMKMH